MAFTDVDIANFISGTLLSPTTTGPILILLRAFRTSKNQQAAKKSQQPTADDSKPNENPNKSTGFSIANYLTLDTFYKIVRNLFILGVVLQVNSILNELALNNYEWVSDPIDPTNQIVVVTGGSGGIGQHYVQGFIANNFSDVVIMDIQPPTYELPPNVHYYKTDLTNGTDIQTVADSIKAKVGDPTVIVHNAGTRIWGHTILSASQKLLKLTFDVNTIAPILVTQQFLPAMIEKNSGHVVTMASLAGYTTAAQLIDYSASKIGAAAFSEGLYQELKHRYNAPNVRNTLVNPTWVKTGLTGAFEKLNHKLSNVELEPEDVTSAVINQIIKNRSAQIYLPSLYGISAALRGWPNWIQERIRDDTRDIITTSNFL